MKFAKIANAGNEYVNNVLVLEKETITQEYNKNFIIYFIPYFSLQQQL